jgi:acyl-CoA reductase-like NAD-dependent aldehyde dehydrogenase
MESATATAYEFDHFYIGGEWVGPSGDKRFEIISPSTEEHVGSAPEASEADVDRAVAAARAAFADTAGWAHWGPARRAEALDRFATAMESRSDQLAKLVSAQNGMPIAISTQLEGAFPAILLRYYGAQIQEWPLEEMRTNPFGGHTIVAQEPIGVVAAIVPWNFPQALSFMKVAPALAAGCTLVVKPSPETPLDCFLVADAAEEAGLPPGVINFVPADRQAGAHLVSHPDVDCVAFTGSTAAGRTIAEACGRLLRPVSLELGGKSAAIVLDDADLAGHMEQLFGACLMNNGQTCWLNSRILAPRSRYDEVVDAFAGLAGGVTIGDALDPATQIGPMNGARQRERVEGYIAKGKAEGARVVVGGGRPESLERGYFVAPTVLADVKNSDTVAREEIFGPVLSVIPYDSDEEAIAIANDSDYGLGGSVWTSDHERGLSVARRVQTGTIGINGYANDPTAPFGGVKASGLGRELGPEGMAHFFAVKSIYLDAAQEPPTAG